MILDLKELDQTTVDQLYAEAEHQQMGLNAFVVELLRLGLAAFQQKAELTVYHDLDDLAGTWTPEDAAAFKSNTTEFEQIDTGLWR